MDSEDSTPRHTNRLREETSPYLIQHAQNPVDWFPWGEEALAKARAEEKPIFLSIGYSACHWCHVMERESFENEDIAALMNEHFVNVKVDREERPDIDEIYMTAVVAMAGQGGWPMSVFLTPELQPFYGGTYYPPVDMQGRPGFPALLQAIHNAWQNRRDEVLKSAKGLTEYVRQHMGSAARETQALSPSLLQRAAQHLRENFDAHDGGWGGAPKFPSSGSVQALLRAHKRSGEADLLDMAEFSLEKMAHGGMYDHLGGGFHRYSVDAQWLVPHFEKMLYDNAQLSQAYLEAFQVTGKPLYARVAREILDYEIREMQDPLGGFHSTEDADSEGEEGKFYIWTQDEILEVLGEEGGWLFCAYYSVRPEGNFQSHEPYHAGQNILHISRPPEAVAEEHGISVEALEERIAAARQKLYEVRAKRVRPGLDDKILSSWNGLMITALAQGAQILHEPRYREAAERAGAFLLEHMLRDGRLLRTHRHGDSRLPGYLDDHAFVANGLVDLYEATFDPKWLDAAEALLAQLLEHFWDDEHGGGFFLTTPEHGDLIVRTKPTYDGAEPSGNSVAALLLLRMARLLGKPEYETRAREILESNHANLHRVPQGYLKMLLAVDFLLGPSREIALVGQRQSTEMQALLDTLHAGFHPNKVVALLDTQEAPQGLAERIPLLAQREPLNGKPAAYVCENHTCKQPVSDPDALKVALD